MLSRILRSLLCAVCLPLFAVSVVFAQKSDTLSYELNDVVVRSSLVKPENSSAPLYEFNGVDIRRWSLRDLSDAAKRMAGVHVHDYGGTGGLKTVSVRGLGAKHTAVSYDGAVVSDAQSGMVDIGRFSLENVSSVSLAIGQNDDISLRPARDYSLATLLSLKSSPIAVGWNSSVKLQSGSFGLASVSAYSGYGAKDRRLALALSGSYLRSDGMYPFTLVNGGLQSKEKRRDGDVETLTLEGNVKAALWGGMLTAKVHYYDSQRGLPGAVNLYNKENRERLWNRNLFAQASYGFALGSAVDARVVLKYDFNYIRHREINKNYYSGEQVDRNRQNEYYLSVAVANSRSGKFNFSAAADVSYATLDNNFESSNAPRRFSSYTVLAANYELKDFLFTASLLAAYIKDEVRRGAAPEPYKRFSPALSLAYRPAPFLLLRVSCKDAYRVPTFADLYYLRLGNVALRPERATQYNVGITFSNEAVMFTLDAYYNNVRDKIVALPTMYVWRMMNFGEADVYGADANFAVGMSLSKNTRIVANASYSWQRALDVTDKAAKNYRHQLPYTPQHSGNLSLAFENPLVNVSYMLTAVGERYMLPQNTVRNKMNGYIEHSFSAYREFSPGGSVRLLLQGEVRNAFNEQYEIIRYYPMPGISWNLSACIYF